DVRFVRAGRLAASGLVFVDGNELHDVRLLDVLLLLVERLGDESGPVHAPMVARRRDGVNRPVSPAYCSRTRLALAIPREIRYAAVSQVVATAHPWASKLSVEAQTIARTISTIAQAANSAFPGTGRIAPIVGVRPSPP